MYLGEKDIDELMELVEENGYESKVAIQILEEMEFAKKLYEQLIQSQGEVVLCNNTEIPVIKYYLFVLEQLKDSLPYDAMGGQFVVPLLVVQEFRCEDIVEKVKCFCDINANPASEALQREIQRFITVQLDPQGMLLYMDILGQQSDHRRKENYKNSVSNVSGRGCNIW